jgi:transcriptional regulator with XRE-family HTH domain
MIKSKLKNLREQKFTQEEFAHLLEIETSNYNRRENGITKISKREWDKMAKLLSCKLEEIYEPEDGVYIINNENASGNYSGSHNHFGTKDDFVFETMKKYITKLEDEITQLKEAIQNLKKQV